MSKILSIIIPTYNMEKYLRKCLDSLIVCDEKMKLLEVLVINDGSKDSSSQIAHEYASQYPDTFVVIDKENGNYGSCVNRGLKEASGKYVKILDADDYFDNQNFAKYIDLINNQDVDLIINDTDLVDQDGNRRKQWTYQHLTSQFDFYAEFFFPTMHCVAYRTDNLRKIEYKQTEGISYTDQQWVFLPLSIVDKSYYTGLCLYKYLVGREGQTMDPEIRKKSLDQRIRNLSDILNQFENQCFANEKGSKWLEHNLLDSISIVYKNVLIDCKDDRNSMIIAFDEDLKANHHAIYEKSMDYLILNKKLRFNYGLYWRKYHKINRLHPYMIAYNLVKFFFKNK